MRALLAAICVLTLLAVGYLSVSLIVLQPPRANYAEWFAKAGLIAAQAAITLLALQTVGWAPARRTGWRALVLAGGMAAVAGGVSIVRATLSGNHFEGYALVLGSMVAAQGLLTVAAFLPPLFVDPLQPRSR